MKKMSLNGTWLLSFADPRSKKTERIEGRVPGDVHVDMMNAGLLEEPLYGMNLEKCLFMEKMDFVYEREIVVPPDFIQDAVELVFHGLDMCADIFLNGTKIKSSNNTHVAVSTEVRGVLKPGTNVVQVRIDSGLRQVGEKDPSPYAYEEAQPEEDHRRVFIRKPQFIFRWDNIPHLLPCGIHRDVEIRSYKLAAVRDVYLSDDLYPGRAHVKARAEVECLHPGRYSIAAALAFDGKRVSKEIAAELTGGINELELTLEVPDPQLWWPNGYGAQPLYDFSLCVSRDEVELDTWRSRHGIRVIKVLQEDLGDEGKSFTVTVNGVKVFCKGSDWVPADALYARVSDDKYRALVRRAIESHHTMFRVWGGGIYEKDIFYDLCDQHGILIWHDFMFACSYYPDEDKAFVDNCVEEFDSVIRRLRNHASLALWCGNNEMQWIHWQQKHPLPVIHGFDLVERILPEKVRALDPDRFFWMSSPYGFPEDSNRDPNSDLRGDSHIWLPDGKAPEYGVGGIGLVDYTGFAKRKPKFTSEYGILAPPVLASIKKYTPANELYIGSPTWLAHNDTWDKGSMDKRLELYYRKRDEGMSFQEAIDALQMLQGEAYKYCTEHMRRRMFLTSGSLFWMFADCWGGVSWTVVDYYLNLLPSFYFVKRAYAPIIVSLVDKGDVTEVWVCNDTRESFSADLQYGIKSFDGTHSVLSTMCVHVSAACSGLLATLDSTSLAEQGERYAYASLRRDGEAVSENRLFYTTYGKLSLREPELDVRKSQVASDLIKIDIACRNYARVLLIEGPEGLTFSDNAFDIGAGEHKTIWVEGDCNASDLTVRTMNGYAVGKGR